MAKTFGFEALHQSALKCLSSHLKAVEKCSFRFGDTPIEQLFFAALMAVSASPDQGYPRILLTRAGFEPDTSIDDYIFVQRQVTVNDWRVDFLIHAKSSRGRIDQLVVECDGHDFHERTKEQAARDRSRDRALQASGITVFRFTGAEIWRDPWKCAEQAMDWAQSVVCAP